MTKYKKEFAENIIVLLICCITTFLFLVNSPFHPWTNTYAPTDSAVFKTITMMMENGAMPYKDSFDHKGPILYVINWLGDRIAVYRGVWVLEFLSLVIAFFFMYKIACLLSGKVRAVISVFVSISIMFGAYCGGNICEEYALPFIAVSLFFFGDYLKNNIITRKRLLVCGLSFACVLLLKANLISTWLVFCPVVLFACVKNKKCQELKGFIAWFLVGAAIVFIPVVAWLYIRGALAQCWNDYIIFNRLYVSAEGGRALFTNKVHAFFFFCNRPVIWISLGVLIYMCFYKSKRYNVIYIAYILLILIFASMSGMAFVHYAITFVPAIVYPISCIFAEIDKMKSGCISLIVSLIVSISFLSGIILPDWINLGKTIPAIYQSRNIDKRTGIINDIANYINNETEREEAISVYGNWDIIYLMSGRRHATRYSYQFPVGQVLPDLMKDYMNQLQEELPRVIVIEAGFYDESIAQFLINNNYILVLTEDENSMDGAMVFKR